MERSIGSHARLVAWSVTGLMQAALIQWIRTFHGMVNRPISSTRSMEHRFPPQPLLPASLCANHIAEPRPRVFAAMRRTGSHYPPTTNNLRSQSPQGGTFPDWRSCPFSGCRQQPWGIGVRSPMARTHAWPARWVKTLGSHPHFPVLGATCQIQGTHPSPRRTPAAQAAVPGGWIYLTRIGFSDAHGSGISFPLQ